jgi:phage FluMu gp28-like protein
VKNKLAAILIASAGFISTMWMPYQQAWINDKSDAAIWEKSRRIGADYCESYKCVHERLSGERTVDYWYSSADESAALEFGEYIGAWLKLWDQVAEVVTKEGIDDGKSWLKMTFTLPEIDGKRTRITVMTSNPKRFRSKGGDVTLSELAFHENPMEMWKAAAAVATWGGRIRVLSSHNGCDAWFNRLLIQAMKYVDPETHGQPKATDFKATVHSTDIYDAIADGLCERINQIAGSSHTREEFLALLKSRCATIEIWAEEYECKPSKQSGSYFPYSLTSPCVTQDAAIPTEFLDTFIADIASRSINSSRIAAGCDIGRTKDRFVIWVWGREGTKRKTLGILVYQNKPFGDMETAINTLLVTLFHGKRVQRICIDSTGLGMQLAERMEIKHRARAEGVTMTQNTKHDMFTRMRAGFEDITVEIPDDDTTRSDISSIRKEVTAAGNERYLADTNDQGHSDRAVACALGLVADESAKAPMKQAKMPGGMV